MNNIQINRTCLPTPKQTVKINLENSNEDIFAVVDVVTLDGRIKIFSFDDLKNYNLSIGFQLVIEYGKDNSFYKSGWKIDYLQYGKKEEEKPALLLLSPIHDSVRIQRRKHFRLPIQLLIKYKKVVFPSDFISNIRLRQQMICLWHNEQKTFQHKAQSVDISEEGLCFNTNSSLYKDDELVVSIQLSNEIIVMPAIVMWSSFKEVRENVIQKVGVQFICEKLSEKKKIREFIFFEQRKQLQRKRDIQK